MAWNGAGVFNRLFSWTADKAAAINITASRMDSDTNDIVTQGLGNCITRDGQGQPTANLPMATFRHTGVANGVARTDYAAMGQLEDGTVNWAAAGGGADALAATYIPALTALVDGQLCWVRAAAANATTTPTFAPNGLAVHTITKVGGAPVAPGDIAGSGHELILRYKLSSTVWELLNPALPVVYSNDAGAGVGPSFDIFRDSASPAASDFIGSVDFNGRDSAGNKQLYARIVSQITDATSTSEDASLLFQQVIAGTLTNVLISNPFLWSMALGLDVAGNMTVNTNKFTVAAASGNTVAAGTIDGTSITASAALSGATAAGAMLASQSDQETGTATNKVVQPGVQQFHPSAAKWWLKSIVSAGTPAQTVSYNVTSLTDTGVGRLTVTIGADFSSADWVYNVTTDSSGNARCTGVQSQAAGSVELQSFTNAAALVDPISWAASGFGDQ